jgi:hypothetical protein
VFDDRALADPLTEGELSQALGKPEIERVRDGSDADGSACSRWTLAVISGGTFRTGGDRDSCVSSGHNRFLLRKK